jgi:hypothetical protein
MPDQVKLMQLAPGDAFTLIRTGEQFQLESVHQVSRFRLPVLDANWCKRTLNMHCMVIKGSWYENSYRMRDKWQCLGAKS